LKFALYRIPLTSALSLRRYRLRWNHIKNVTAQLFYKRVIAPNRPSYNYIVFQHLERVLGKYSYIHRLYLYVSVVIYEASGEYVFSPELIFQLNFNW